MTIRNRVSRVLIAGAAALALVVGAAPARAITDGVPDAGAHPYVGLVVFTHPDGSLTRCSGTLLAPKVFLTAGHCTFDTTSARVWFDDTVDISKGGVSGTPYVHPLYDDVLFLPPATHDVGVVILDKAVKMSTYGALPRAGLVDSLAHSRGNHSDLYAIVGYGRLEVKPQLIRTFTRYRGDVVIKNLENAVVDGYNIQTSGNSNTNWSGSTCFGDSGGPLFLDDTNVVIGITSFGNDPNCKSSGYYYRTDIEDTRSFLDDFLTVP